MRSQCPVPVPASPRRHAAVLAALAIAATLSLIQLIVPDPAPAQLSTTGKWTGASPSALSSNGALTATGIHMAWMRGDPDWVPGSTTRFHSYLFWFNHRTEFCVDTTVSRNSNPRLKGALYGWRPDSNMTNTGDMMSSGFTRIQLDDVDLDPGGDAGGHDIFCSGNSLLDNGLLMVAGGAEAEGAGSFRAAVFDPHVTSGSRWTQLGGLVRPRWYPSIVQTATKDIFAYAGTQHPRVAVLFGKAASGAQPRSWIGRHAVSSSGTWDSDALPTADALAASGNPDGQSPRPRYYPAGGAYRVGQSGTTRTVMFGGRDSTQGWSGAGGSAVRSDVWWLEHRADDGVDSLKWVRFNTYEGDQPADGLWKHSAIVNENTAELWAWGGIDGNGDLNGAVFRGRQIEALSLRKWDWKRFDLSGGPSSRQLASAAYDEQYNRMIVYGGYTDAAGTTVTADDSVYALSLTDPPTWKRLKRSNRHSTAHPLALAEAAMIQGPDDTEHLPTGVKANMYLYGGTSGGTGASGLKSDVWLMYFPHPDSVSWEKLNIPADPVNGVVNHQVPGPRRGATAIRDHNSWNLRVYGGFGPDDAATDGYVYRVDIFRDASSNDCNTAAKPWVPQYATAYHDGGRTGALVVFDPYEVSTTTLEYRTPSAAPSSTWQEVANCERFEDFYPLLFPLPDGSFFDATARGFARPTYRFDRASESWKFLPEGDMRFLPSTSPIFNLNGGSGVMRRLADGTYDIMKCGLKDTDGSDTLSAHGMTGRLKLSASGTAGTGVGWVTAGTMQPRVFHNLVTLPDGKVLVTGGASVNTQGLPVSAQRGVQRPQIWDPAGSGSWSTAGVLADEGLFRGYHSAALVMPDGRIVTGGGNDDSTPLPHKHQFKVYAPPQWYDANGAHPATGTTLELPDTIGYGATLTIKVDAGTAVQKVVLLRPGAVTHGFNSSQMYAELAFSRCEYSTDLGHLEVTTPAANAIPPGDYLLFVVIDGHWSTGRWLRLKAGAATHYAGTPPASCPTYCSTNPEDPACGGGDGGGIDDILHGHSMGRDTGPMSALGLGDAGVRWNENTLFAGVGDGEQAEDRLHLPVGPLQLEGVSRVRLRHRGPGSDAYTDVRLVAVDHAEADEAVATASGIMVGTRGVAVSMLDGGGNDVAPRVVADAGLALSAGDIVNVVLPSAAGSGSLWLATSGHPVGDGGIRVDQLLADGWHEVAVHTPRNRLDVQVIGGLTSTTVRLVAFGQHRLHGVGRFVPGASPAATVSSLSAIQHSASGPVASGEPFTLSTGDTAWVDFVAPAPPETGTRSWFLEVSGTPQGYQPSARALHARHAPIEEAPGKIKVFRLAGGIPNPFTSTTRVLFELPRATNVRLEVFDMQGRIIRRLEQRFEAGVQSLVWDRHTTGGSMAPRGVYPIRVTAGDEHATGRLTVR